MKLRRFLLIPVFVLLTSDFVLLSSSALAAQGVPTPPNIPISPRRAAAFGATIVTGLLALQYAHRRKPFILLWLAGWGLIVPMMLLLARGYESVTASRAAVGAAQFLGVCSATFYFWSADVYRYTRYVQPHRLKALPALGVLLIVVSIALGPASALVLGFLITAALLAATGALYAAIVIERHMIGAGLIAFVMFGLAVSNVTTTVLVSRMLTSGEFVFEITTVNAVLYTFCALGIHQLVFEDMTYELRMTNRRLESAREELLQASITDPLTGCHNRRFLEQVMYRELQRHRRFNLAMSLLFIDIDRFKAINDSLGHDAGDRVLQYVARFLKRHIREADYVFRWGGDEFLALITCTGEEHSFVSLTRDISSQAEPASRS
ncbi:MAG: hypothetical protein DMG04_28840 [Acidobacteria bacterium]|nr:MAG: hypothetical protein DMG04_28840 [Acidobacteriota bacterium]